MIPIGVEDLHPEEGLRSGLPFPSPMHESEKIK